MVTDKQLNKKMSNFKEGQRNSGRLPIFKYRDFKRWFNAQNCAVCGQPIGHTLHEIFIQVIDAEKTEYGLENIRLVHKLCFIKERTK